MARQVALVALAAWSALGAAASAQPALPLTLDQAVASTLQHVPQLVRYSGLQAAAKARLDQDTALDRPQLLFGAVGEAGNANATFNLKAPNAFGALAPDITMGQSTAMPGPYGSAAALTAGQVLWSPILSARTSVDQQQAQAVGVFYITAKAEAIRDVKQAYIEALRTQRQETLAQAVVRDRETTLRLAKALSQAGLTSNLDAEQAQVRVQEAQAELLQARNNADSAYQALLLQMGYNPTQAPHFTLSEPAAYVAPGPTPPQPLRGAGAPSNPSNPLVLEAQAQTELARTQIGVAQSANAPALSAYVNAGVSPSLGNQAFSRADYAGGLEFTAPIFTSGLSEAQVREAKARVSVAEEDLRAADEQASKDLITAQLALEKDRAQREVLNAQVQVARHALDLARRRYQYRLASFLDVVNAETAEATVETRATDADYAVRSDRVLLAFLQGTDVARYAH